MQTSESVENVKYTINISQNVGKSPEVSDFLGHVLESLLVLLEKKGQSIEPLFKQKLTPERLESLLAQKKSLPQTVEFSQNKSLNAFMGAVEKSGGITQDTMEEIQRSGREFREDFELRHDQL